MGSGGSVEQKPAEIIVTTAVRGDASTTSETDVLPSKNLHYNSDNGNHSNLVSSPSIRLTIGGGSADGRVLFPTLHNNNNNMKHIEYVGLWEYKLATDGAEDDASTWRAFSSSDQDRLEECFSRMKSEVIMAMVGKTAWNVHVASQTASPADNGFGDRVSVTFHMTRGSGHAGLARRRRTEKADAHAPSPFDDLAQSQDASLCSSGTYDSPNSTQRARANLNEVQDAAGAAQDGGELFEVSLHSTIKAHHSLVYCIDFSRDGTKVLSGSRDGTFRYWQLGSSSAICDYLPITDGVILSCSISPNQRLAVCGSSNTYAYLWSTDRSSDRACGDGDQFQKALSCFNGHTHKVYGAKFTSDSRTLVTGSMDHSIRTWDVVRELPLRKIVPHTAAVFTIAASKNSPHLFLSGADDHNLVSHDLRTPSDRGVAVFRGHRATIWASDIRFDDLYFLSAGMDGACLMWDARNPTRPLLHVGDHGIYPVHCAEFMPEGNYVLTSARDSTWRLWDVSGACKQERGGVGDDEHHQQHHHPQQHDQLQRQHEEDEQENLMSASSSFASSYNPLRRQPCCKEVCKVSAHKGNVFKIAYEPIRNLVMSCGSDGLIKVFNLNHSF